jgi:hypothetical protein
MTGVTKIKDVIVQRIVAPKDARPLIGAIVNAINPRLRQPNTSIGVAAIARNSIGIITGINMS